jgi:hypothetical protein
MFAPKAKKGGGNSALSNAIANQIQKKPKTVKPAKPRSATPTFVAGTGGGIIAKFLRDKTQSKVQSKLSLLNRFSTAQKNKQDAETKANQAENAAVAPAGEGAAMSNAGQVETVEAVAAPNPQEAAAKAQMNETLNKNVPKSLEQIDEFKSKGKGKEIGDSVKGVVSSDTEGVKSTYKEVENAPAPVPSEAPDAMPEPEAAPAASNPNVGEGVVGETTPKQQDMTEFSKNSDSALEKEGIKEEEFNMVTDGELADAKKERTDLKKQVTEAPKVIQKTEQTEKKTAQQELQKEESQAKSQIKSKRQNNLKKANSDQKKGKSSLETKRAAVTAQINGIYDRANKTVKSTLEELEKRALKAFDDGQKKATTTFETNVKTRLDAFKRERYSGVFGGAKWLKDKLLGMDDLPQVKQIFDEERTIFVATIDVLIKNITAESKRVIQACKDIIANAKKEIARFVATLGPSLRSAGLAAQKDIQGKLDTLDKEVNDAQKKLEEALAKKREAAIKAIDDKIAKMKEAMKGALGKLLGLILEALLKFFKWALKKAGMNPEALLAKVSATIKAIVKDPKGFFRNLAKAFKTGIENFKNNIQTHLIKGMMDWLTGAMQGAGITLPTTWDLKGIMGLVLQILGLTWANIRRHMVDKMGDKVVNFVETAAKTGVEIIGVIKRVRTEGVGVLWDMIKEKAEEFKGMVMEQIRNFLAVEVIKAGIIKLVSMLNPVGAIVQAIMAIYNTVMFFVENASRIADMISSIFSSISSIAAGAIGSAAASIENAMARTIPIIINFILRLIGLGGIGQKIAKIIKTIQKPVNFVLDKIIGLLAKFVKPLVEKGMALLKKGMQAGTPEDPQKRLELGMNLAVSIVNKLPQFGFTKAIGKAALSLIKIRYQFQSLELIEEGENWSVEGTINPNKKTKTNKKVKNEADVITEGDNVEKVTTVNSLPRWIHNPNLSKEDNARNNIDRMRTLGRTAHSEVQKGWLDDGFVEQYISPQSRPDGVKFGKAEKKEGVKVFIRELKPNTNSGKSKGKTQLNRYVNDVKKSKKDEFKDVKEISRRLSLWEPLNPFSTDETPVIDSTT